MGLLNGLHIRLLTNRRHPLLALVLALIAFGQIQPVWAVEVDNALKQHLISALAIQDGVKDQFDMSVWITDMEGRLEPYIEGGENRLRLLEHIYQESLRVELPPELILAVIHIESNFDRFAISRVGARGLMQIMPFWLDEIGRPEDNLFNIETNLRFGCTILRHYIDKESGDITRALARYNGSRGKRVYPDKIFNKLRRHWYRS
ncbi:MAG: transglycosylase SLT domain-containing protein [Gammaproteobacteria bacterium]|nr:transglycosylase SLT domain-containing protein [Gammaproteobacteria bacterium]